MHTLILESKDRVKSVVKEKLDEAIDDEDIDGIHKCYEIVCMYHYTKKSSSGTAASHYAHKEDPGNPVKPYSHS